MAQWCFLLEVRSKYFCSVHYETPCTTILIKVTWLNIFYFSSVSILPWLIITGNIQNQLVTCSNCLGGIGYSDEILPLGWKMGANLFIRLPTIISVDLPHISKLTCTRKKDHCGLWYHRFWRFRPLLLTHHLMILPMIIVV